MMRPLALALVFVPALAFAGGGNLAHKPDARPIRLFHAQPSPKGTIVMFHGFSRGPQQWAGEAQRRFGEGYDVIVAALPGHGFVDKAGNENVSRVPTATQSQKYAKFGEAIFDLAAKRSDKVYGVGFSVGGAVVENMALAKANVRAKDGSPVLRGVVAVNPYIGPNPQKLGPFHIDAERVIEAADKITFGLTAKLLAKKPYPFKSAIADEQHGAHDVGFTSVSYNNVLGIGRFGDSVRRRGLALGKPLAQPNTVVLSDRDPTANPTKGAAFARSIGARTIVLPLALHDPLTSVTPRAQQQVEAAISDVLARGEALR